LALWSERLPDYLEGPWWWPHLYPASAQLPIGLLGAAVLAAAGGSIRAVAGEKLENSMTEGLPEDELFIYEDALRKGRSVVVALSDDEAAASRLRELLTVEGVESVDVARKEWWVGLRSAEREHYSAPGRNFDDDEKFYRLGFESALHARTRCKEYDQVSSEMTAKLEEPGGNILMRMWAKRLPKATGAVVTTTSNSAINLRPPESAQIVDGPERYRLTR
jgi:hypothetical protein